MEELLRKLGYGHFCDKYYSYCFNKIKEEDSYDILPVGETLQVGDEFFSSSSFLWKNTGSAGDEILMTWTPYRRLKPGFVKIDIKEE